ncbi:unannotated protein [freshwater metagenome]|uniref:Unannotated protein n=1 Tax=freshwater metagenome TaxID=449393 RepID=A0A6J7EA01_9ZZZZ
MAEKDASAPPSRDLLDSKVESFAATVAALIAPPSSCAKFAVNEELFTVTVPFVDRIAPPPRDVTKSASLVAVLPANTESVTTTPAPSVEIAPPDDAVLFRKSQSTTASMVSASSGPRLIIAPGSDAE